MSGSIIDLLVPGGSAREWMKMQAGAAEWADHFCNQVVEELSGLAEIRSRALRATTYMTPQGEVQLNIRWSADRGWSVYIAPSLTDAVAKAWQEEMVVAKVKGQIE